MPKFLLEQAKSEQNYPKILFIGAVTFEETTGSHILFYRMFKTYPADKLVVVGSHRARNLIFPSAELPDVSYSILEETSIFQYSPRGDRFFFLRRINDWIYSIYLRKKLQIYERNLIQLIESYEPDLILSLTMDFQWYVAYKIAKKFQIPLDLILHDRWEPFVGPRFAEQMRSKFEEVYQFARHRFCISPTMERLYYQQTGIHGDVLFPIGDDHIPSADFVHADFVNEEKKHLTVVFFGNIWIPMPTIIHLAHCLFERNIELVLFSDRDLNFFINQGLQTPNICANPFMSNKELLTWCKMNADILYLPMYFDKNQELGVQYSFKSKLVDYTSLGLPIIIHAPKNSSIVEFVEENKDTKFAEVVTSNEPDALVSSITGLMDDSYRKQLGENSLIIWQRFFAGKVVRAHFLDKITVG